MALRKLGCTWALLLSCLLYDECVYGTVAGFPGCPYPHEIK